MLAVLPPLLAETQQNRRAEADRLFREGQQLLDKEEYQAALIKLQQALKTYQAISERSAVGTSLSNIGSTYYSLGQYAKALEYHQQSLAIRQELGERSAVGTSLSNIGSTYYSLGQYAKALEYHQQSLAISREVGDRSGEGASLSNIGRIYDSLGQYAKALEYHQQSLAISREVGDRPGKGTSLNNIGLAYDSLGQYTKALEYHQQSLAISREVGDRSGKGTSLNNIGRIYDSLGQYAKALEYYQQSLAVSREVGDRSGEGTSLNNIGLAYDGLGQYTKALEYYQQSLAISREVGDRPGEGTSLNNIGISFLQSGKASEAEVPLFEAIEVFESLRPGLTDENKVSLFDTQADTYRFLQEALIAQNEFETALEVAERGRARSFIELLKARIGRVDNQLPELAKILRPTITQIKQIAKQQESTLVQYSIIDDKTLYIWVIQPNGNITHRKVALPQQLSLSALVETSREAIGVRGRGNFKFETENSNPSNLKQLHQLLIEPIADLLPIDPNTHVIFVPHGELFLVPFPALQDAQGRYLLEKHTILTSPAIQVLELTRQRLREVKQVGSSDALIVGNPVMPEVAKPGEPPERLKSLGGAEQEANAIAALFKTKAWTGQRATKSAIVAKLPQARIIHLATHGLLDDLEGLGTPGAIALAPVGNGEPNDGLLTANKILDLKLNAELVVLSACDTGRGRITSDSVIGLSRSLIIAGTPSVIVSLWSVPDAPTAELMTEFYRNWQERKLDKAQALRQAMLMMMKRSPQPRNWAAFTLIGESE
uniref:CHAT domain-containing protein n=1 Tax=Trichocoleus desertorum TaxID=1481672 RepID=UPI0025B5C9E7|nr:CHAT domain-containing tetratricopeptide repeat protein [Trichocoleus desertorum]